MVIYFFLGLVWLYYSPTMREITVCCYPDEGLTGCYNTIQTQKLNVIYFVFGAFPQIRGFAIITFDGKSLLNIAVIAKGNLKKYASDSWVHRTIEYYSYN